MVCFYCMQYTFKHEYMTYQYAVMIFFFYNKKHISYWYMTNWLYRAQIYLFPLFIFSPYIKCYIAYHFCSLPPPPPPQKKLLNSCFFIYYIDLFSNKIFSLKLLWRTDCYFLYRCNKRHSFNKGWILSVFREAIHIAYANYLKDPTPFRLLVCKFGFY